MTNERTDGWTDLEMDGVTWSLLELLIAAKTIKYRVILSYNKNIRQGASITRFVGWGVGLSVCRKSCYCPKLTYLVNRIKFKAVRIVA